MILGVDDDQRIARAFVNVKMIFSSFSHQCITLLQNRQNWFDDPDAVGYYVVDLSNHLCLGYIGL